MTCKNCAHQFCWMCMSRWQNHETEGTGCKTLAQMFDEKRKIATQKAEAKCIWMQKFKTIWDPYLIKITEIENKKKDIFEQFEKVVLPQTRLKMKKQARNFCNFIFGNIYFANFPE